MLYARWTYRTLSPAAAQILPDGCCDIILLSGQGAANTVVLTEWDMRRRQVRLAAGTSAIGYRLRPGVFVHPDTIGDVPLNEEEIGPFIDSAAYVDSEICEVADVLARSTASVNRIARTAGVSPRSLQRWFLSLGLPPPIFWRMLGRGRRAAWALTAGASLAEIAHAVGYSDQAHMTREFVRWFGVTPTHLRADAGALAVLSQPGLGNWIGEQSSIR